MPKVRFNPMVVEIQGTIYDVVFKKSSKGQMIVTKRPDMSTVQWSEAQKSQREQLGKANDYAHAAMADPDVRLIYEKRAAKDNRVPYRVAMSDYYKGRNLLSKRRQSPPSQKPKGSKPVKG